MGSSHLDGSGSAGPLVVGLGGATRSGSSTEMALRAVLDAVRSGGARTVCFGGETLASLPLYRAEGGRTAEQAQLVEAIRAADGVVIATPGYHGGVSGLVKNALDLLEDLRDDARPYLHERAVGCIVTGYGWQTCGTTLAALRSIVHALRGWPTPLGVALNVSGGLFDPAGACSDPAAAAQLRLIGEQVIGFARRQAAPARHERERIS
jgi:FMN reductase